MAAYFLVIFAYAGAMSNGDSVALTTLPQPSLEACQTAGKAAQKLATGTVKNVRFTCIKGA